MSEPILEARGLTRRYGSLVAVDNLDLVVERGEVFGLVGPKGAGKTTLADLISGLTLPTAGRLTCLGRRIDSLPPHEIARLGIARTFQPPRVFHGLTARENVALGARFGSAAGADHMAAALVRADELLRWSGLGHRAAREASGLAPGERTRLELTRALAMEPRLLLLDEVTGGLERPEAEEVLDLVQRINQTGVTVLLIEPLLSVVLARCAHILVLRQGARLAFGSPEEIAADPAVLAAWPG